MKKITKTLLALGTGFATGYGLCRLADEMLFNRKLEPSEKLSKFVAPCDETHLDTYLKNNLQWVEDYGYEKHYIYSDRGEKLTGFLMKPDKPSNLFVFCAHGYRSSGKGEFCGVSQFYLSQGINVFFPDHIASGESEGTHCTFGFYEHQDCMKWLHYIIDTFGNDIKILLHGVSMGSATVCMMSGKELPENVKGVVADCGYSSATELFKHILGEKKIPFTNVVDLINVVNKQNLGFDLYDIEPAESVKNSTLPFLVIHGKKDGLVPCYMAEKIYDACGSEDKILYLIDEADHAQAYYIDKENYEEILGSFIEKHLK